MKTLSGSQIFKLACKAFAGGSPRDRGRAIGLAHEVQRQLLALNEPKPEMLTPKVPPGLPPGHYRAYINDANEVVVIDHVVFADRPYSPAMPLDSIGRPITVVLNPRYGTEDAHLP